MKRKRSNQTLIKSVLSTAKRVGGRATRASSRRIIEQRIRRAGVRVGEGSVAHGMPIVSMADASEISFGPRAVITSVSARTALGVSHPVVLRTLAPGARITVGADAGVSGATICSANAITIGSGVLLGADCVIVDTDFHSVHTLNRRYNDDGSAGSKPIWIGDNVFIGARAILLKGSEIGDNSVVGAGAVVSGRFGANAIIAGNPAREIGRVRVPNDKEVSTWT